MNSYETPTIRPEDAYENITVLSGTETAEGPVSVILGGVHGDERCGMEILEKLLPALTITRGKVIIAFGNPRAIRENKRSTEANLNRMFKPDEQLSDAEKNSYEYQRAQELKELLDQADALLDVHASSTPGSRPFVICEDNAAGIAESLPVERVVSGFDAVEPGGTDYYMNRNGKIGICVECGYRDDPASLGTAEESILAFLGARGHIDRTPAKKEAQRMRMYSLYLAKTRRFRLAKMFEDFERVAEGQLIGTDGDEEIRAQEDSVILFASDSRTSTESLEPGDEAFLLGRDESGATRTRSSPEASA